jgi:putative membrane protein
MFMAMNISHWDAQWDMFMAMSGAVVALILLSRLHDRSIRVLEGSPTS